jgi:hypothetical protein
VEFVVAIAVNLFLVMARIAFELVKLIVVLLAALLRRPTTKAAVPSEPSER